MNDVLARLVRNGRGQRAPAEPENPPHTHPEYERRTKVWLGIGEDADRLVTELGPEAARAEINKRVGIDLFFTVTRYLPQLERVAEHGFLLLPGGCQWALKTPRPGMAKAGCTFCEFQEAIDEVVGGLRISEQEYSALVHAAMATFAGTTDIVRLFTGGSGLYPGEIPIGTMQTLARLVAAAPRTQVLGVESRVQFIIPETLAIYQDILVPAGKSLEVMIGFETLNDDLRNGPKLNKGMTRKGFEEAVKNAKAAGARVAAYVILMPVEMTERESIDECVDTILYLRDQGVDEAMLQARYSHHPHIRCPKLWSITHVLEATSGMGIPVTLGDWRGEMPEPKVWPKNCGACDDAMMDALQRWRLTLEPHMVTEGNLPTCPNNCRARWAEEVGL